MKHSTYTALYQRHLGAVDEKTALRAQFEESDPFFKNILGMTFENKYSSMESWNTKPFTKLFLSGTPRQRLDETFFAFVLRTVAVIKGDAYIRSFKKPGSEGVLLAWHLLLRNLLLCSLALLYDVEWTLEKMVQHLDPAVMKLLQGGNPFVLRELMTQLGISFPGNEFYQAERSYEHLHLLNVVHFGSFYWRFLHWMAEAVAFRGESRDFYKREWMRVFEGPLCRTLSCPNCIVHFLQLLEDYKTELSDPKQFPHILFRMHNDVQAIRRRHPADSHVPDYTEAQYEVDAEWMRQALSA